MQVNKFLNNTSKGMVITDEGEKLSVSTLFNWYEHQFKPSVKAWVRKHAWEGWDQKIEETKETEYMHFQWSINIFDDE